ncbi:MAG: DUF2442 domain-containing protein [Oscillospiraceae bacterium]|jgi:hypothetical protein|nr:DUF2442 domain-containing protein [Oscillospiraceae bacterium]
MVNEKETVMSREPLGPRVVSAKAADGYKIDLLWNNGERRVFNAEPLLQYSVFARLRNKGFFSCVKARHGSIEWPGDIDYCPDTLYMQSVPVNGEL